MGGGVNDQGFFGSDSVSWRVHREVTVLFGGARALLMQAAHPLVIAGARETGFYQRDPWKRLQRTLMLTYALTFGTRDEALRAAARINAVHRSVHGIDEVTGKPYDAFDPDLLLWVHACLVDSALLFERYTVGRLDDAGRQRFHEEQMAAAELLELPRERIPPTVQELNAYVDQVVASGDLLVTDAVTGAVTSYTVSKDGGLSVLDGPVSTNGQAAPCWLVTAGGGRYAYSANTGSGTISGFSVHNGRLSLLDPTGVSATSGSSPFDLAVSRDGHFLYNLASGSHELAAFGLGSDGSLTSGGVTGLPASAAGLATG